MNRLNPKLIVLILLLIALAVSVYIFNRDKREETIMTDSSLTLNAKLAGAWSSSYPEPNSSGLFAVRNFSFTGDNWSIDYTLYADAAASNPLFTFTGAGAYEIQSPSSVFENTHNALFKFNRKNLTLKNDAETTINGFGFADCGLTKDVPKDISETGCSFFPSVTDYGQEYDLIKVEDNKLWLGARPADENLSTEAKRPAALGPELTKR